jgi:hypothetical protein
MTLLSVLISLFTSLSVFQPLKGYEPSLRDDPLLETIGEEQSQGNPADMARSGMGGGHCPRG